jgi:hypothetical protein
MMGLSIQSKSLIPSTVPKACSDYSHHNIREQNVIEPEIEIQIAPAASSITIAMSYILVPMVNTKRPFTIIKRPTSHLSIQLQETQLTAVIHLRYILLIPPLSISMNKPYATQPAPSFPMMKIP